MWIRAAVRDAGFRLGSHGSIATGYIWDGNVHAINGMWNGRMAERRDDWYGFFSQMC